MEIRINDKKIDVSLEDEKNVGEVLSALEQWLNNSGHRLTAISIDGQLVKVSMIEEIFSREIDTVSKIDLFTDIVAELAASSLIDILHEIKEYENLNFEERANFTDKWKDSAAAAFICSEMADLYTLCISAFSGQLNSQTLYSIVEERLREVKDPLGEFEKVEPLMNEICERLVQLPLDIQTGKDMLASQTIQLFSGVTEKIFRLFKQFESQDFFEEINEKKPLSQQLGEFGKVLRDLLDAYEKNDSVLVGDIAEYETSPKLKELYLVIKNNIKAQETK